MPNNQMIITLKINYLSYVKSTNMKLPVYNCLIEENPEDQSGIYAISFVDAPANETAFIALRKQPRAEFLSVDCQKQILTGVVLRPEQMIYRNSPELGEHYIKFSAEQIEKISHKMMRTGLALRSTTHQHLQTLEGNYLIELWIVEDPENDKSRALGFEDLPKGTLMCSYKIEDKEYWDTQVLTGNVKGFSLEGLFFREEMKRHHKSNINKKMNMNRKDKSTLLSKIANFFLDIEAVRSGDSTQSGTAYVSFTLADGKEILVDADGFTTLEGKQLPAGEHLLADGNLLSVDEQGQFTGTKEASDKNADPESKTAPQALRRRISQRLQSADQVPLQPGGTLPEVPGDQDALAERITDMENKLADMQNQLDQLLNSAETSKTEVENMRRNFPSGSPLTQTHRYRNNGFKISHTEKMAASLALQVQRRK